jgi:glyoxylase-like metal-dependent hydrolase (beta-lactamase superfamily II)
MRATLPSRPMRKPTRPPNVGRGEKVVPGVWRLRLPLPWPGVPHCNAWALAAGDGIVLVDCGMHEPGSLAQLERALAQVGLRLEDVRLLVCTHAHADHCGQASAVQRRSGCELWMHPAHQHLTAAAEDPEAMLARRAEIARQSGVPEATLRRALGESRSRGLGLSGPVEPARDLVPGVVVSSDVGDWDVIETPGHAPSHVCLHQPQRRLLISGDHLLGRISLYFDYGWTPDPVGEFVASLDTVDRLGVRLALSGHGRPFTDVHGHVEGNRALVAEQLASVRAALAGAPATAYEIAPRVYGDDWVPERRQWLMTLLLCWLGHLEVVGEARSDGGSPAAWTLRAAA